MRVQLIVPRTSEQQPFDCPNTQATFYTASFTVQKQCRERWTDGIAPWAGSPKIAPNTADDLDTDNDLWVFGETEEKVRFFPTRNPNPARPATRATKKCLVPHGPFLVRRKVKKERPRDRFQARPHMRRHRLKPAPPGPAAPDRAVSTC